MDYAALNSGLDIFCQDNMKTKEAKDQWTALPAKIRKAEKTTEVKVEGKKSSKMDRMAVMVKAGSSIMAK